MKPINLTILVLAIVCLMLISIACQAQVGLIWSDPVVVAPGSFDNTRPRVALVNGIDPIVLWGRSSTDVNYVSKWNGAAFNAPEQITPAGTNAFVATWAGSEIATAGDTVFVVYVKEPAVSNAVYTRRSLDGGLTWEDSVRVDGLTTGISQFPSITTGASGRPIITFMDHDLGWTDPRYVVANSNDGGGSYEEPVPASAIVAQGEVCDCCPADIIQGNGKQVLLFRNNDNNERDIWAASSDNAGISFSNGEDIDFGTLTLTVCPSSGPSGIISGDSLYFAWMNILGNSNRVNIGSAGLNDLMPITNSLIDASVPLNTVQNYPRMAGMNDTLAVVWEESISGSSECVVKWSVNGVQGLSVKDTVNLDLSGGQTNPDIAYSNGYFHFVWQNNSSNEVIYRRAQVTELTSIPEGYANNIAEVNIARSGDQLIISALSPIRALSVFDVQGRMLGTITDRGTTSLEWPAPIIGTYLFHVILEDGRKATIKWSGAGQ